MSIDDKGGWYPGKYLQKIFSKGNDSPFSAKEQAEIDGDNPVLPAEKITDITARRAIEGLALTRLDRLQALGRKLSDRTMSAKDLENRVTITNKMDSLTKELEAFRTRCTAPSTAPIIRETEIAHEPTSRREQLQKELDELTKTRELSQQLELMRGPVSTPQSMAVGKILQSKKHTDHEKFQLVKQQLEIIRQAYTAKKEEYKAEQKKSPKDVLSPEVYAGLVRSGFESSPSKYAPAQSAWADHQNKIADLAKETIDLEKAKDWIKGKALELQGKIT